MEVKLIMEESDVLLESAKLIFGDLVVKAYVALEERHDTAPHELPLLKERFEQWNQVIDMRLDFDYGEYLVLKFVNGNKVVFFSSEWGIMKKYEN